MELIRKLWDAYEEREQNGQRTEAIETCCQLTQLLMGQVSIQWRDMLAGQEDSGVPEQTKRVCIAMMKAAGSLQVQLDAIAPQITPGTLMPVLEDRLKEVQAAFGQLGQQAEEAEKLYGEILSQETELKEKQKEKTQCLEKAQGLTALKETGLAELERQIREEEKKLEKAEKAYEEKEKLLTAWKKKAAEKQTELDRLEKELEAMGADCEQELRENETLLTAMPEKSGLDPVDALIEKGRQQQEQLQKLRRDSNDQIRQIIEQIHTMQIPL